MGVVAQHRYRTGFLKSEWWLTFRVRILVARKCTCDICGHKEFSNDVHHIFYPDNIRHTKSKDVVVLCRRCHDLIHELFHPKTILTWEDAKAAYDFAKLKILSHLRLELEELDRKTELHKVNHCWCCRAELESPAHYNIFKFAPMFPVRPHHFIPLCHDCGNLMWDNIVILPDSNQRSVFKQYEKLKPIIRNRLTKLLA